MENNPGKKIVIIGSGIGGLSCAIILLKLGYDVTVIEKNRQPGGMMRSYGRKGFDCPVGVHYLGSLGENQPLKRMFDFLGVSSQLKFERIGANGFIDRYFFDDFTFDFPEGIDGYENNLRSKFPADGELITAIINGIKRISPMMESFSYIFNSSNHFENIDLFHPMGELLAKHNCSRELRGVLEVPCSWIGIQLEDCPMFYHHIVLLSYLFSSWKLKSSGIEMAELFASRVKGLGGKIILGDEVVKIAAENKELKGVLLKSGEYIESSLAVAAIHPQAMLELLDEGAVKPAYKNRIEQIKNTPGIFSAHFKIDPVEDAVRMNNYFRLKTHSDGNISRIIFFQIQNHDNKNDILTLVTSGRIDEWDAWETTKTGKRGNDYIAMKDQIAKELLSVAEKIIPVKNAELIDAYTPLSIRDWVNSPGGSAYGVLRSREQLVKTASLNRTSVKGLYLAGQSVLAPGILGTVLGSLVTAGDIAGNEILKNEFFQ